MIERLPGLEPKDRVLLSGLRFVMIVCGLLLVANLLVVVAVWLQAERISTPVHVSCSRERYSLPPQLPLAVDLTEPSIASHLTASGEVRAEFTFQATTREPGSRYSLRYRLGDGEWREAATDESEPLQYVATTELAPEPDARLSYQAIARLGGEMVAASDIQGADLARWVGSPDMHYYRRGRRRGSSEISFSFRHSDYSPIEAWRVVAVRVNAVYADRTEAVTVDGDEGSISFSCTLANEEFLRLEVEAEYGDGLVVKREIKRPYPPGGEDEVFLTRPRGTDLQGDDQTIEGG